VPCLTFSIGRTQSGGRLKKSAFNTVGAVCNFSREGVLWPLKKGWKTKLENRVGDEKLEYLENSENFDL